MKHYTLYITNLKNRTLSLVGCLFALLILAVSVNAQPVISSFSPISGPVGTTVTINGNGFDATAANNTVYFGATKAVVTVASATSLTVTVPASATFQPINVINTLTNLSCNSALPFNVTFNSSNGQNITSTSFNARVNFTSGANPAEIVAVADIDGDGKPDMVVVNRSTNTFSVFRNTNTSGTISTASFATKVDIATDSTPSSIAIGDLDGDGKPDIVITNQFLNKISVYRNTATAGTITTASFAAKVNFITDTLSLPTAIAIGDIDGDGKPDVAVTNSFTNTVSILKNTSTVGSITSSSFAAAVDYKTGLGPTSVAIADIDGDGKPDLVVADFNAKTISVLRNKATVNTIDTNSLAAKVDFATGTGPYALAVGDLNADGKADIAVANQGSNTISIFANTAVSGTITAGSLAAKVDLASGGESPYYISIGNIDGDDKPDIFTANLVQNNLSVIKNVYSSGTISNTSFANEVSFATGNYPFAVSIADFDGDGKPDLAVPDFGNNNVTVYKNNLLNIVPVNFLAFTGQYLNPGKALLKWQTGTEINTAVFNIQRSLNGTVFTTIGNTPAAGYSNNYSFTDVLPVTNTSAVVYYRLQEVDKDGTITYSSIVLVNINKNSNFTIYPNPAKSFINIQTNGSRTGSGLIIINDIIGNKVLTTKLEKVSLQQVSLFAIPKGVYTLSIITSEGKQTEQIVVE